MTSPGDASFLLQCHAADFCKSPSPNPQMSEALYPGLVNPPYPFHPLPLCRAPWPLTPFGILRARALLLRRTCACGH